MTSSSLLPSGFSDLLPPQARTRRMMMHHLISAFEAMGAEEVFPAMIEFEESTSTQSTDYNRLKTFRVTDPMSHKTLSLRADMTGQIARIANGALSHEKRPLTLCYGGTNLRVSSGKLEPRRQLTQVGVECFGATEAMRNEKESRMLAIAIIALNELFPAIPLTLDLAFPSVACAMLDEACEKGCYDAAYDAMQHKSSSKASVLPVKGLKELISIGGNIDNALTILRNIDVESDTVRAALNVAIQEAETLAESMKGVAFDLSLTLDPLDTHGQQSAHYTTLTYSLFMEGIANEIGRGGRYVTPAGEEAMGVTLYLDTLIEKASQ